MINKNVLSWESLHGGDVIKGEVIRQEGENYVVVKINDFIEGRVYREHLSDIPLKKIPKSFATNIGKKMKFRILFVNQEQKIVELTLKDLLIRNKKKMPLSFNEVEHGRKFTGVIVG